MDWPPGPRPIPSPVELGLVFVVAVSTNISQDNPGRQRDVLRLPGPVSAKQFENPKFPAFRSVISYSDMENLK